MKALQIVFTLADTVISLLILLLGFLYTRADTNTGGMTHMSDALWLQCLVVLLLVVIVRISRPGTWTHIIFAGMSVMLLAICTINWFDVPYEEIGGYLIYRRVDDIWTLAVTACLILVVTTVLMRRGRRPTKSACLIANYNPAIMSLSDLGTCIPSKKLRSEQDGGGNAHEPPTHPSTAPSKSRATP